MRINRWLFAAFVYLTFMGLGIISGGYISTYAHSHINHTPIPTIREPVSQTTQPEHSYPVPTLPKTNPAEDNETYLQQAQQTNYLLLFVDDLSVKKPKLTNAYIWILQNDAYRWTFLPIYDPKLTPPLVNSFTKELEQVFSINNQHQLNQAFIDRLTADSILWHHFLLMDNRFLSKLSDLEDIKEITPLRLMQQYCQIIPQTTIDFSPLTDVIDKHFYADSIPSFPLQPDSMTLNSIPLECHFPTLSK